MTKHVCDNRCLSDNGHHAYPSPRKDECLCGQTAFGKDVWCPMHEYSSEKMKLEKPFCAECGKPAIGTIESVIGLSTFEGCPSEGEVSYDGNTDMNYSTDEQKTVRNDKGECQVACENHHRWFTNIKNK